MEILCRDPVKQIAEVLLGDHFLGSLNGDLTL